MFLFLVSEFHGHAVHLVFEALSASLGVAVAGVLGQPQLCEFVRRDRIFAALADEFQISLFDLEIVTPLRADRFAFVGIVAGDDRASAEQ